MSGVADGGVDPFPASGAKGTRTDRRLDRLLRVRRRPLPERPIAFLGVVAAATFLVIGFLGLVWIDTVTDQGGLCTVRCDTIGSAFAVGGAEVQTPCPSGDTFATNGCAAGHYGVTLFIESSTVTFGTVQFAILTPADAVYVAPGGLGFSILSDAGQAVAQFVAPGGSMGMNGPWTFAAGVTGSTPLTTLYVVEVDLGRTNPVSLSLTLVPEVAGGGSSPISLP